MINQQRRYLIDSNSIITPYKTFYPFDLAEKFWIGLAEKIRSGEIILLDLVSEEIRKGDDNLTTWINDFDSSLMLSRNNQNIISTYSQVMSYIQKSDLYNEKALRHWSDANVADPWLIATGKVYEHIIVTFENPNGNLSSYQPTKNPKIPDVSAVFNVECCNLYNMMRDLRMIL
ncbi:PIN domain protein [Petrocella atlantisensis]|uniref:PIN domain protein n=1 Tax=Petrocella atlantisensis TaxID=2173034 RepID=A0A3P7S6I3_9FIRM|nr:DUF4411 family protein [Petrocella atlantisensis]VDN47909.1 PIN domain protein [Petrocella atlantisensis]